MKDLEPMQKSRLIVQREVVTAGLILTAVTAPWPLLRWEGGLWRWSGNWCASFVRKG